MRLRDALLAAAVALGLLASSPASAQMCQVSTTAVAFGSYDVFDTAPLASTGSVGYVCLFAGSIRIWLSKGSAPSNNPRQMTSGASVLSYNLYLDPAHTLIWGDPNPGHYDSGRLGLWVNRTVTVYGLIPAGQDVAAGMYRDTIVVTFQF